MPEIQGPTIVWQSQAVSQTLTYPGADLNPTTCGHIRLAISLSEFSGSLDFQASVNGTTWVNVPYTQVDRVPYSTFSVNQLAYVLATETDTYAIPGPWKHFRIVMVRTAGSITAWLMGSEQNIIINDITFGESLPSGTNPLGKLAANDGVDIGDVDEGPVAAAAGDVHAPAANTAAIVTYAATASVKHVITGIAWSYAGGIPTGGNLKVEDVSGTTVFTMDITDQGAGFIVFPKPKKAAAVNTAMIVTLAAGGASVTGKVSVVNHWTE